ncbi:hypothetical protein J8Z25_08580 [Pseudoalteromonas sp. SCSIO 43101]|nr:hypothetical protein J8Z25_08580 [Pseudoalteromonas sp. SCSIO 43101]
MSIRNISKLPSITAVEPGNTVSLDVPVGLTYDKIHFKYSDTTEVKFCVLNRLVTT